MTFANKTAQFLGKESNWRDVMIELVDVHGLQGGSRILIYGNGKIVIQLISGARLEERYEFKHDREAVLGLIRNFIDVDFVTLDSVERLGYPDEVPLKMRVVAPNRMQHKIYKWAGVYDPCFDRLYQAIRAFESETSGLMPTYEGRYQDYYYPPSLKRDILRVYDDWAFDLKSSLLRMLPDLVAIVLMFLIAYFWVRIDPMQVYGFGGGVAQGYVWLQNWVISWFDGRYVWAPSNVGTPYLLGFGLGIFLPLVFHFSTRELGNIIKNH